MVQCVPFYGYLLPAQCMLWKHSITTLNKHFMCCSLFSLAHYRDACKLNAKRKMKKDQPCTKKIKPIWNETQVFQEFDLLKWEQCNNTRNAERRMQHNTHLYEGSWVESSASLVLQTYLLVNNKHMRSHAGLLFFFFFENKRNIKSKITKKIVVHRALLFCLLFLLFI